MSGFDHSLELNDAMLSGGADTLINASTDPAYALIFDTTRPVTPGGPVVDTPLVTLLFAMPACSLVAHQLVFFQGEPTGDQILVQGNATWARLFNGDGVWLGDCDVTDALGAGPLKISGTTGTLLYAGARAILDELVMA